MIKVIMTTFGRVDLLTKCITSIVESDYYPKDIEVFDDCSEDVGPVMAQIERLQGVVIHHNDPRIGCDGNTPHALAETFKKFPECNYILIVDSDLAVTKEWWAHIERCAYTMAHDAQIGSIQCLNLDNIPQKKDTPKYSDLLECVYLSACGLLVSRTFYETYVTKMDTHKWFAWDVRSTEMAHGCGLKNYVLKETAMQHLGMWDGAHKGPGQTASTFVGKISDVGPKFGGTNVYFLAGDNFCDIALSVMAGKIVKSRGYRPILVNPNHNWGELVSYVTNKEIIINDRRMAVPLKGDRYNYVAHEIQEQFGGVAHVLNFETDSDESRWLVYSCSGDAEKFVSARLGEAGIVCTKGDFDWQSLQSKVKFPNITYRGSSIGNHTLVNNLDEDMDEIKTTIAKLQGIVKYVAKERPSGTAWRQCLYNATPLETVAAINSAGMFVSVMNKSSFAILFCTAASDIYDMCEFNEMKLPNVSVTKADTVKSNVCVVADFELTEEMKRYLQDVPVHKIPAEVVEEWIVVLDKHATGFYPGWVQDLIGTNWNWFSATNVFGNISDAPAAAWQFNSTKISCTTSERCRLSLRKT